MPQDQGTKSGSAVMPGPQAAELLKSLEIAILSVLSTPSRARRGTAGAKGKIPNPLETLKVLAADCKWSKVFGTPRGVAPAVPLPIKGEEVHDPRATMLLNPELRKTFGALWVLGDGIAQRELKQMRLAAGIDDAMSDGSDEESYGDSFDYDSADSDVTHGWNSQDDSLSSDDDVGDEEEEEEEDQVDSSALPDLEYATKGATAPTFV